MIDDEYKMHRCDYLMWLKDTESEEWKDKSLSKIQHKVKPFIQNLNLMSYSESGDKSLWVDEAEFVLTRYNGASNINQNY